MRFEVILRTLFYTALTAFLFFAPGIKSEGWSGMITGALVADYLTWLFITMPGILDNLEEGAWEALVNLAAGVLIFNLGHIVIPRSDVGLLGAYFAFFVIFAIKAAYHGCKYFIGDGD